MIVVSNTTPLIGLAVIQRFDLLRQMFGAITIAPAVWDEAVTAGREAGGAKAEVLGATWIQTVDVADRRAVEELLDEMDLGEAQTIVLAQQLHADWVLMDEKKGRRKATQLGLNIIGTIGILLKAKEVGLLTMIHPELTRLRDLGFSISQSVYEAVLRHTQE